MGKIIHSTGAGIIVVLLSTPLLLTAQENKNGFSDKQIQKNEVVSDQSIPGDANSISGKDRENRNTDMGVKAPESIRLLDLFRRGGPFMWPILLFAAIAGGFIIERFIFFKKSRLNPLEFVDRLKRTINEKDISAIENICREDKSVIAGIIIRGLRLRHFGVDHLEKTFSSSASVHVSALEKGLSVLSALGNIVPMLGFLGTVSGMINAFSEIAAADQINARIVAGGIQEALITTAAGLIVAIPTLFFYNYFVHRIDIFVSDVESITMEVIEKIMEEENG